MKIDLIRDGAKEFPIFDAPEEIRQLRVWHCKYKVFKNLKELRNLEELIIATYPEESFECVAKLSRLKYLSILHMPKVTRLDELSALQNVNCLSLSTLPSSDAGGKYSIVECLSPIAGMGALEHLELFGVRPPDKSLRALYACGQLKSARFSQYPKDEVADFYKKMCIRNEFNPKESF